jgi:HPr kinase/phosphorylase
VLLGEAGILIRGPSGAGKSSLAYALLKLAPARGMFARLVCDDRVALEARAGRLLARAVPPVEGLIEIRGEGLLSFPFELSAVVRLAVDCLSTPGERLPEQEGRATVILGVALPRMAGLAHPGSGCPLLAEVVLDRIGGLRDTLAAD